MKTVQRVRNRRTPRKVLIKYVDQKRTIDSTPSKRVTRKSKNNIDPLLLKKKNLRDKFDKKITQMIPKVILKDIFHGKSPLNLNIRITVKTRTLPKYLQKPKDLTQNAPINVDKIVKTPKKKIGPKSALEKIASKTKSPVLSEPNKDRIESPKNETIPQNDGSKKLGVSSIVTRKGLKVDYQKLIQSPLDAKPREPKPIQESKTPVISKVAKAKPKKNMLPIVEVLKIDQKTIENSRIENLAIESQVKNNLGSKKPKVGPLCSKLTATSFKLVKIPPQTQNIEKVPPKIEERNSKVSLNTGEKVPNKLNLEVSVNLEKQVLPESLKSPERLKRPVDIIEEQLSEFLVPKNTEDNLVQTNIVEEQISGITAPILETKAKSIEENIDTSSEVLIEAEEPVVNDSVLNKSIEITENDVAKIVDEFLPKENETVCEEMPQNVRIEHENSELSIEMQLQNMEDDNFKNETDEYAHLIEFPNINVNETDSEKTLETSTNVEKSSTLDTSSLDTLIEMPEIEAQAEITTNVVPEVSNEVQVDSNEVGNEVHIDSKDVINEVQVDSSEIHVDSNEVQVDLSEVCNEVHVDSSEVSIEVHIHSSEVSYEVQIGSSEVSHQVVSECVTDISSEVPEASTFEVVPEMEQLETEVASNQPVMQVEILPEAVHEVQLEGEAVPEVQLEAVPEVQLEGEAEVQLEGEAEVQLEAIPEVQLEAVPAVQLEGENVPEVQLEGENVPEVQLEGEAIIELQTEAVPELHSESEAVPEGTTQPQFEVDAQSEVSNEIEIRTTEVSPQNEIPPQLQYEFVPEHQIEVVTQCLPDDLQFEVVTDLQPEVDPQLQNDVDYQLTEGDSQPEVEPQPIVDSELQIEFDPPLQPVVDPEFQADVITHLENDYQLQNEVLPELQAEVTLPTTSDAENEVISEIITTNMCEVGIPDMYIPEVSNEVVTEIATSDISEVSLPDIAEANDVQVCSNDVETHVILSSEVEIPMETTEFNTKANENSYVLPDVENISSEVTLDSENYSEIVPADSSAESAMQNDVMIQNISESDIDGNGYDTHKIDETAIQTNITPENNTTMEVSSTETHSHESVNVENLTHTFDTTFTSTAVQVDAGLNKTESKSRPTLRMKELGKKLKQKNACIKKLTARNKMLEYRYKMAECKTRLLIKEHKDLYSLLEDFDPNNKILKKIRKIK